MKSLEDFESMTVPQIKGILTGLGVDVPKDAKKPDLVRLAFDVQQPVEPEQPPEDPKPLDEQSKEINTQAKIDEKLEEIADFYEGEIAPDGENEQGETIFVVTDLAGDEVARGTFLELQTHVENELKSQQDDGAAEGFVETPLAESFDDVEAPPVQNEDNLAMIEDGLKPLATFGLRYTIDGSVIKLTRGGKTVSTTVNQPAHRVVRTAETLCNFR